MVLEVYGSKPMHERVGKVVYTLPSIPSNHGMSVTVLILVFVSSQGDRTVPP